MGSKVYWNCLIGSMAEQISILHMEVNFQFVGMSPNLIVKPTGLIINIQRRGELLFEDIQKINGDCGITGRFANDLASLPEGL